MQPLQTRSLGTASILFAVSFMLCSTHRQARAQTQTVKVTSPAQAPVSAAPAQAPAAGMIVGTWQLIAADKILPDGKQVPDYGSNPQGIVIFTADGHYTLEIFKSERMKFSAGDRSKGTPEEYKDAVMSTSCHFGTYEVDGARHTITFHISHASYPNWDMSTRVSPFMLQGDTLSWRVPARPDGSIPISVFKKVD
jgi:hypothetical protein